MAVSILPGTFAQVFSTWLGLPLSFLAWGITMALLDLLLEPGYRPMFWPTDLIRDWLGAQAFAAMYLLVIPLTSLYIDRMMSSGHAHGSEHCHA